MDDDLGLIQTDDENHLAPNDDIRHEKHKSDQVTPIETSETKIHNDYIETLLAPVDSSMPCTYTTCEGSQYQPLHPMMFYDNSAQNHIQTSQNQQHLFGSSTQHYWDSEQYLQMPPMAIPMTHDGSQYLTQNHRAGGHNYPIAVALPATALDEDHMAYDKRYGQNFVLHDSGTTLNQSVNNSKNTAIASDIENANDSGERRLVKRRRRRRRKRTTVIPFEHWSPSSWQDSSGSPTSINRALHNEIERRRRHRITECCDALKELVPGLSDKTDKATVLEQTVKYVKHIFDCPNKCNCEFVVQEQQQ